VKSGEYRGCAGQPCAHSEVLHPTNATAANTTSNIDRAILAFIVLLNSKALACIGGGCCRIRTNEDAAT